MSKRTKPSEADRARMKLNARLAKTGMVKIMAHEMGDPTDGLLGPVGPLCAAPGCSRPPYSGKATHCKTHYTRILRNGTLELVKPRGVRAIAGIRPPEEVTAKIEAEAQARGVSAYRQIIDILTGWAASKG